MSGFAGNPVRAWADAHYAGLYRYAYRLAGSAADADDLTQETFARAHNQASQLRDPAQARAWLYRILRNLYLMRLRDRKRRQEIAIEPTWDVAAREEPSDEMPGAIDPERLHQALAEMPETYRSPVILFYFEDFSYRDIAEQMDMPIGTVMSRLNRAKAFLRERLTERKGPES